MCCSLQQFRYKASLSFFCRDSCLHTLHLVREWEWERGCGPHFCCQESVRYAKGRGRPPVVELHSLLLSFSLSLSSHSHLTATRTHTWRISSALSPLPLCTRRGIHSCPAEPSLFASLALSRPRRARAYRLHAHMLRLMRGCVGRGLAKRCRLRAASCAFLACLSSVPGLEGEVGAGTRVRFRWSGERSAEEA